MKIKRGNLAIICLFFISSIRLDCADQKGGELVPKLSPEEYAQSGLQKLTRDELTALDAAIRKHLGSGTSTGNSAFTSSNTTTAELISTFGAEEVEQQKITRETVEQIRSRIEGEIDGIYGRAIIALENGQVWQVRMPDKMSFTQKLTHPEVIISRGIFGYKMHILQPDRIIPVRRIK